jgi:hypothetical protein
MNYMKLSVLFLVVLVFLGALSGCTEEPDPDGDFDYGIQTTVNGKKYNWERSGALLVPSVTTGSQEVWLFAVENGGLTWEGELKIELGPYVGAGTYKLGTATSFDGQFIFSEGTLEIDEGFISPSTVIIASEKDKLIEGTFSLTLSNSSKLEGKFKVKLPD